MAATQIENSLFRKKHRSNIMVAFHNQDEYLHRLSVWPQALGAKAGNMISKTARR